VIWFSRQVLFGKVNKKVLHDKKILYLNVSEKRKTADYLQKLSACR
jgi:hypothetical protein